LEELPKELKEKINSIENTLQEILKWTRFANISKLKEILVNELDTDEKKLAYENSDGENTVKELVTLSGAPYGTIVTWWPRWYRMGIMAESQTRKGRMKKIIALSDIGISFPKKTKTGTPDITQEKEKMQTEETPKESGAA